MADIDFQNGFLCGMATKGLVRSGELYKPLIWNDDGVYSYFYIDFRREMEPFSLGMFDMSIVIHDSVQLPISRVAKAATGIYKVFCDISDKPRGITVLNKKTSKLMFATGERLPVFSVHMFIAGQPVTIEAGYVYDNVEFDIVHDVNVMEASVAMLTPNMAGSVISEWCDLPTLDPGVTETASVALK